MFCANVTLTDSLTQYTVGLVTALVLLTAIIRPFIVSIQVSLFDNIRHYITPITVQNINNYAIDKLFSAAVYIEI